MSRESMFLLAGGAAAIAFMVYMYENQHAGMKGAIPSKYSAAVKTVNIEATDSDNNTTDPTTTGKPGQAKNKTQSKPPVVKELFVAFNEWPNSTNNYDLKPEELLNGDTNEIKPENNDKNFPVLTTPQSVLDDELKNTSDLYKGLANRLDRQHLSAADYNSRIRRLQLEYDEKIKVLFKNKQKLNAIQKFIDNGTVTPEDGAVAMWRVVLPTEALQAVAKKGKPQTKERPASAPAYGAVTGIIYNNEAPLATIDGEIYRQGETVHGVRITKILKSSVEFEYKGHVWSQSVNEAPPPNWP